MAHILLRLRRRGKAHLAPWIFALLTTFSAIVRADNSSAPDAAVKAREHYDRGTKLFDLRRYKDAAREYEAAYELREEPELLFDIAQSYRYAAMYEEAVASYRAFLRREPRSPRARRGRRSRIHEMQELLAKARKTHESPPQGAPAAAGAGRSRPSPNLPTRRPSPPSRRRQRQRLRAAPRVSPRTR